MKNKRKDLFILFSVAVVGVLTFSLILNPTTGLLVYLSTINLQMPTQTPSAVPSPSPYPTPIASPTALSFSSFDFGLDPDLVSHVDFVVLEERTVLYNNASSTDNFTSETPPKPDGIGDVKITYKTYDGKAREVYWVDNWYCENITQGVVIRAYVKWFRENGVPLEYGLPLIQSESNFQAYVYENGQCRLKQNNQGAPAYGPSQLFGPAHTEIYDDYVNLATSLDYNVIFGGLIYKGMTKRAGGDWIQGASYYKGFANSGGKSNQTFIDNYMPAYNRGYYTLKGITVPYNDSIDSVLNQLP